MEICQSSFQPTICIKSTIFLYCFTSVYSEPLTDPPEMKWFLVTLCFIITGVKGGQVVNSEMWLRDVEEGKLPELSPDQQRYLFGGNIKIDGDIMSPAMNPISWYEAVERGLLPPLSDDQKSYLFGGKVQLITEEPPYPPNQANRRSETVETSFLNENILPLKINEVFSSQSEEEGRGRLKKIMVPVILAMTIIAAILLPALMTVIKLIAVKGLWSGVVSLIISKLLGFKALLNHHHHHGHHSEDNRRPYFVYLPNGKHRREEEENLQEQRQPYDQWLPENYDNWKRDGATTQLQ